MMSHRITVNGQAREVNAAADTPLLYVLRNDLGLNGPKFGCGLGQCGACAAIIAGNLVRTCSMTLGEVGARPVTTLEGLGTAEKPHSLQSAFIAEQAAQCGYCTNGMVMASAALIAQNPKPSLDEIKQALSGNLCRCGTHDRVLNAVMRATGRQRT
jgi:nicotinate dehydrogenase subunit A